MRAASAVDGASDGGTGAPAVERIRHEARVRSLTVSRVEAVTPAMRRITFGGDDLADFDSRGFDDHVKLLVRSPAGPIERRDYTPRRFDPAERTLTIDFALHDVGVATSWARDARPGDPMEIAGPKGSRVVSPLVRRWLLIGDETALPAIGRLFEEASPGVEVTSLVAITGDDEQQSFATAAQATTLWVHRPSPSSADPAPLLGALDDVVLRPGTYAWVAAEGTVAKAVRERLMERGHPPAWLRASGYWVAGKADAHVKLD